MNGFPDPEKGGNSKKRACPGSTEFLRGWVSKSNRNFDFVPYTHLANVTGLPAMSVPLHWNDDGLPIGVHFVGRFGDEASLFRLAAQLEQVQPWIGRTPSVTALQS